MAANSKMTVAVHALAWLEVAARHGRSPLNSSEIAASLASHPVLVRRSLAPLRDSGLVSVSGRGPGAGWTLGRPACDITLAQVYEALGGSDPFSLHPHEPNQECVVGSNIGPVLAGIYDEATAASLRYLSGWTVADVVAHIETAAE